VRVAGWADVEPPDGGASRGDFSARFSCTRRTYRYFFLRGGLDLAAMRAAAERLRGRHDFRNFAKFDVENQQYFVRRVEAVRIVVAGSAEDAAGAWPGGRGQRPRDPVSVRPLLRRSGRRALSVAEGRLCARDTKLKNPRPVTAAAVRPPRTRPAARAGRPGRVRPHTHAIKSSSRNVTAESRCTLARPRSQPA
jgi:hypothetical protein